MRLQLVDLKNQNDVLRSNVHRLTAELGNSQAQRTKNPQVRLSKMMKLTLLSSYSAWDFIFYI